MNPSDEETARFVSALAHDLKGPLRSVMSYTQLLGRRVPDDPEIREFADHILVGAAELNAIIERIQTLAAAGKPKTRTTIGLNVIVQMAVLNLQKLVEKQGAQVNFRDLPKVEISESQFVHLFEELIGNSLKYRSSEAPRIDISAEETGEYYTISVRDNGEGIQPNYYTKAFEPFGRLHGRSVAGVGLGLTICRRIVEGHGGKIWIESDGQTGTNFRFTIPA